MRKRNETSRFVWFQTARMLAVHEHIGARWPGFVRTIVRVEREALDRLGGDDMSEPGTVTETWLSSVAVTDTLGFLLGDRALFTIGVPWLPLNAGAEYDVPMPRGLTPTARWIHTGPQYVDVANTMSIQARDRYDLGARYATEPFGRKTMLRATVRDVTHSCWPSTAGGYLAQDDPRSVWLPMTTDF